MRPNPMNLTINDLIVESYQTALEKGWHDNESGQRIQRNIGEAIALMHSELSEALEEYRNGNPLGAVTYRQGDGKPEGFLVELADLFIRVADIVEALELKDTFLIALVDKLEFNKSRPYRHGGKRA